MTSMKIVLASVLLASLIGTATGQSLEMKLIVDKDVYYVGEDMLVALTLLNRSYEPIVVRGFDAVRGRLKIEVRDSKGTVLKKMVGDSESNWVPAVLAAGDSLATVESVSRIYGNEWTEHIFRRTFKEGEYEI